MKNGFVKICSMILVIVLLVNMLPLQVMAEQLNNDIIEQNQMELVTPKDESSTDRIVEEIPQKRTEFSKEFLLENGLHMVTVYPEAVHYATQSGWKEIDNTLVARADGTITNTAGVWNVSFPQQLSKDKGISIQKDGYTLSFFMAGELTNSGVAVKSAGSGAERVSVMSMQQSAAEIRQPAAEDLRTTAEHTQKMPEKGYSRITYANVYGSTDVVYDLQANKVKESIVLESHNSALRGYRYTLEVGTMIPKLQEDGQIVFYDAAGKDIVMVMPAPYMIDDAGAYNHDIQVQLTGSGSRYTMTYLVPQQWLAAEDRAWPVILDPVVQPVLSTTNIRDRSVTENWIPSQTWGYNSCGYFVPEGKVRFFLKYQNLPQLTSSDVVVNAIIQMYKADGTDDTMPVYVHKVFGTWNSEDITWANQPNYETKIEDYAVVQENRWYTWDVTDIARGWYAQENTGMMFKGPNDVESGGVGKYKQFLSSDYGENKPILTITFRNNNGLESYWDYTSSSAGDAGTGYVNNYTGNLVWIRDDLGFGGSRMPVSINHVYNANDAYTISDSNNSNDTSGNSFGLGNGWRTNYNQLVYQWSTNSAYYVWEDSDGTDHYFKFSSNGEYKDEDGLELTLTITGSGTEKYSITDKNGNISYFDSYGRLSRIQNNQSAPSSIIIAYDGDTRRISTITDGAGRKYRFEYVSDLLYSISYLGYGTEAIYSTSFEYDGNNLVYLLENESAFVEYTYGPNNLLISVKNNLFYSLNYTYNTIAVGQPARIASVTESHNDAVGGQLTFEYAHNQTTVTDHSGNTLIYQFNNFGNTICIQDDEGHAQYYKYAINGSETVTEQSYPENAKTNQLRLNSRLQNTVVNAIKESGFERGTVWSKTWGEPQVEIVSSHKLIGNHALQIVTTQSGTGAYETNHALNPGETITFSAYVKTGSASASIYIFNYTNLYESERLAPNTDWTRLEVTYTNNTSAPQNICPHILTATPGSCWVDGVQLEYTSTASRYNLIDNGDFAYYNSGWSSDAGFWIIPSAVPSMQDTVYRMVGSPTGQNRINQTVAVFGTAGDSFVLTGWAKGNSAPLWEKAEGDNDREFAVQVEFHYTDGSTSAPFIAQFNPDSDRWQYSAVAAVAAKAYDYLIVSLVYDYNVNVVHFDGIQLFKEEFGTSYTYNNEGNIISATDYANQNAQYNYTGSNLDKLITPTGTGYEYVYDERNNLVLSRSSEGLQYEFTYDTYGNPIQATVGTNMYSASVTKGKTYYIRNRLSGKYMDLRGGVVVIQNPFSGAETQKWEVVQNADGSLSLKNLSNPDGNYLTIPLASSENGTAVHLYAPNHTAQNEADRIFLIKTQGLRIQPAEKYTYKILTKSGDYNTCLDVSSDSTADGADLVLWNWDGSEAQQWYFQPVEQQPITTIEDGSVYQFRAYHSGRYVSVDNEATDIGTCLEQYHQEGLASQKFEVSRYKNTDYYTLIPQNAPDKLLQISSDINYIGYPYLQIGNNTITDSKLFKFEYYAPMQGFFIIPKSNEAIALDVAHFYLTDDTELIFTNKVANINRIFIAEKVSDTIVSTATYSADGNQLLSTTDSLGKVTTYGYDADTGLLEWVQYPEDTESTRTNYAYDSMYRVTSAVSTTDRGNTLSASYAYNDDLLTAIQTPTTAYNFTYGNFALRRSVSAGNHVLATYNYTDDRNNYLSSLDYGNGNSVDYTYDDKGRLLKETFEDGDTVTYAYNNDGNLAIVTDSATGISTKYYYDLIDRLVKYRETGGNRNHSVVYSYDSVNNLTALVENINGVSHTTGYTYDDVNRVSSVTNGTVSENYSYDSLSRVNQTITKNGDTNVLTESYTFTAPSANLTSGQITTNRLQAAGYDVTYSYTYDGNGNILSISDGTYTTSYVYDSANQLIRENNQAGGFTHTWEYDNAGNILHRKEYTYTTGELGTPTDTVTYTYGDSTWGDLLTAYDGQTITNDAIGNMLFDGTWSYTWEHGRELASMSNGAATWSFTYDANGMRTQRTDGGITYQYIYNGNSLSQMTMGNNTLYFAYGANGVPMSVTYNGTTYYYVTNIQGDVIAILNSAGTSVVSYSYDAWGNPLSTTGTMASTLGTHNPLRYRGYVYDDETQLYYLQSRYYNPEVGRFINADALVATGQGILGNNMFAYCRNNPVCRKDISGTTDVEIFDSDGNSLTDDDKRIDGGKMSNGNSSSGGVGGSSSNTSPAQTGSSNAPTSSGNSRIPQYAYSTLDYVKSHNGSPPSGYKGGKSFANDGRNGSVRLPDSYAPYREYDVHPKFVGQGRGTERIVVGTGVAFYTPDHYKTFLQM